MKRIAILIASAFVMQSLCINPAKAQVDTEVQTQTLKFANALNVINAYYVDSIKSEKMVEDAIVAMLRELDPHSVYMSKEEIKKANEPLMGNFEGVGIQFNIFRDTILVVSPVVGGPSEKLGIRAGDKIITVDGEDATGKKLNTTWVTSKLRGTKGTKVIVKILRAGVKDPIEFTIVRDKIPIFSIDASYMADEKTAYIKLSRFAATSMDEYQEAFNRLKAQGAENLILDLRGNSGGFLNTAIELSDEFIAGSKTIVYTEGLNSQLQKFYSRVKGGFETGKLIVLIDEGSASASEIVSGAVQDWDRGLVIGRRSFGKGLVQKPFTLNDGSVIRLTTARYHTPTGRCIQKSYADGVDEYAKDMQDRIKKGELFSTDSIKFPDSLKYYTPSKRVVYGGGGVMPDIFVPLDTTFSSKYYTTVLSKGLTFQFILDYLDKHRDTMRMKYSDIASFMKNFGEEKEIYDEFIKYAESKDVPKDEAGLKLSGKVLSTQLKALLARNLYDMNAYYLIVKDIDDTLLKAIDIMHDNTFKKMNISYK